jgi:hypothetical protein
MLEKSRDPTASAGADPPADAAKEEESRRAASNSSITARGAAVEEEGIVRGPWTVGAVMGGFGCVVMTAVDGVVWMDGAVGRCVFG